MLIKHTTKVGSYSMYASANGHLLLQHFVEAVLYHIIIPTNNYGKNKITKPKSLINVDITYNSGDNSRNDMIMDMGFNFCFCSSAVPDSKTAINSGLFLFDNKYRKLSKNS